MDTLRTCVMVIIVLSFVEDNHADVNRKRYGDDYSNSRTCDQVKKWKCNCKLNVPTFFYFDGNGKCIKKNDQAECDLTIDYEEAIKFLTNNNINQRYNIIKSDLLKDCKINNVLVYILAEGEWKLASDKFMRSLSYEIPLVILGPKRIWVTFKRFPWSGLLLKFQIGYTISKGKEKYCAIFKIGGVEPDQLDPTLFNDTATKTTQITQSGSTPTLQKASTSPASTTTRVTTRVTTRASSSPASTTTNTTTRVTTRASKTTTKITGTTGIRNTMPVTKLLLSKSTVCTATKYSDSNDDDNALIIGCVTGALVLIAIMLICIVIVFRRKRKSRNKGKQLISTLAPLDFQIYEEIGTNQTYEDIGKLHGKFNKGYTVDNNRYIKSVNYKEISDKNEQSNAESSNFQPIYDAIVQEEYTEMLEKLPHNDYEYAEPPMYHAITKQDHPKVLNSSSTTYDHAEPPVYHVLEIEEQMGSSDDGKKLKKESIDENDYCEVINDTCNHSLPSYAIVHKK